MKGAFSLFPPSGLYVRCAPSVCLQQKQCVNYFVVVSHKHACEVVHPRCSGERLDSSLHIFRILLPTQDECQNLLLCSLHYVVLLRLRLRLSYD